MAEKPKYDPNKPVEVVKPKKPAFNPEASFDVLDEKKKSTPSGSGVSPSPSSGSIPPPSRNFALDLNTRFDRPMDAYEDPSGQENQVQPTQYKPNPKNKPIPIKEGIKIATKDLTKKQELPDATVRTEDKLVQNGFEVVKEGGIKVVKPKYEKATTIPSLPEGQVENAGEDTSSYLIGEFGQSAFKGFGEMAKGLAGVMKSIDDVLNPRLGVAPSSDNKLEDYAMYKFGEYINRMAEDWFPTNPGAQKSFITNLASGAGSIVPFVLGGVVGKAFKYGQYVTPTLMGSFQNVSSQYQDAVNNGADEDTAMNALWQGLLTGSLEGAPIGSWAKKLNLRSGNALNKTISKRINEGFDVPTAVQEGFQEFSTQVLNNASAKALYDETRSLLEGGLEAGTIGVILGKTLDGISAAIQAKKDDPNNTPSDLVAIQKTEKYVNNLQEKMVDVKPNDFVKLEDDLPAVQALKKQKAELEMDIADANISPEIKEQITAKVQDIDAQIEEVKALDKEEAIAEIEKEGTIADLEAMVSNLEAQKENATPATQELLQPQIDQAVMNLSALKAEPVVESNVPLTNDGNNIETVENKAIEAPENVIKNTKGKPLTVYHGTSKGIKAPELKQSNQAGDYGTGIYFATDKREAAQRNSENIIEANIDSPKHLVIGSQEYFDGIYKTLEKKYGSVIPREQIGEEAKAAGYTSIEVERPEGSWIIAFDGAKIKESETTEPITKIENEKPTTTTTPKKTSTGSNAKSVRQDAEPSADKRPVKKVTKQGRTKRNQRKPGEIGKKALEYFPSNAKDVVMQWFIGGGRIKRSVIEGIYGKKADREFSTRVNLLDSESTNRTIQGTADELYALFGSEYENFNSEDYREALEEVISEYRHPNAMAKDLVKKNEGSVSEQDIKQAEYERGLYEASKSVDEETDNADVDNAIGLLETMSDEEIAAYVAGKDKAFEDEVGSMQEDWLNAPMEEDGETPWDEPVAPSKVDKVISALENAKIDTKGTLNAFGILPEIWNTAIDGLILAVKAAKATADIVKAVDNFIKELKDKGAKFDEKEVRDSIEKSVGLKTETKAEEKPKPEKPKEEPEAKEEPKGERRFTKQAIKEYPDIESVLDNDVIYYEKLPNKVTLAEANAIIEYLGVEEASKAFADVSNGMTWPVRNTVGQVLLKRLQADGDYDTAIEVLENLTKSATELGQGIQALSMFKLLTPEGQLRVAQKEVNKQREKKRQKSKAEIDSIAEGIQQINEQAAEEAVDRVSGKVAAAETIKPKETKRKPEYGTKNKVVSKKRYDELKTKLKGKFFSGLDPELVEFAIYHAEAAGRKFGDFAKQMIADLGNKVKPYLKALYDQAQERLKDQYDDFSTEAEVQSEFDAITGRQVFPETKEKAKTDDKTKVPSVRSIVKSFYGSTKHKGQTLAKALETELSLDAREAKDLADSIQREFDKLSKVKKVAMIEKIIGKSTDSQKVVDELVKLSGLGGMSYDSIVDAYADKMGWPKLTESNVKEITRLSEKVQSAPEGFKQFRAIEDLLKYQAGIKGLDKWDVPMAIWYANILSGYKTQFVNLASNLTNASGEWLTAAVQNPKTGVQLARAYWNGVFGKGLTEGAASFKTGYSPIRGKVEIPSVLERVTFMGGKFNPANYAKFVRRAMVAVDVVMFEGLKEMRAFQWANMMASESGVPPTEGLKKRAMEYMNENDTTVQEAQNQAQMEYESEVAEINASGLTIQEKAAKTKEAATDRKRRVYELIEKNRPDIIQTESQSFGARGTYNYKPEGVLGWAASILNSAGQTFPPFKFIVPFTNIIANVANEAINYTPWGFARGFSEGSVGAKLTGSEALRRKDWDSLSPKQQHQAKVDLITKAAIGTTLMTALMVLTQKWGDDDEPEIEITANGTGDYKKNYQLQETGWQPYSIRIGDKWVSYQNSPLLVAFALVGNIRDYETYRKEKMTDEGLSTKIAIAANNTKSVLLDMTFLKGLNTFMQSAMSNETEDIRGKAMQAILNTGKNFVLPNIYTQAAKDIESAFGIPTKEVGATTFGSFLRDIPVARDMYFNKVNILGEPVIPDTDKFVSFVKESPLFTLLAEKKVFISPPSIKASTIIDPVTKKERLMTQEEFYKFATLRGEYIKGYLERNFEKLSKQSPEKVQEKIQRIQGKATINAKSEL